MWGWGWNVRTHWSVIVFQSFWNPHFPHLSLKMTGKRKRNELCTRFRILSHLNHKPYLFCDLFINMIWPLFYHGLRSLHTLHFTVQNELVLKFFCCFVLCLFFLYPWLNCKLQKNKMFFHINKKFFFCFCLCIYAYVRACICVCTCVL